MSEPPKGRGPLVRPILHHADDVPCAEADEGLLAPHLEWLERSAESPTPSVPRLDETLPHYFVSRSTSGSPYVLATGIEPRHTGRSGSSGRKSIKSRQRDLQLAASETQDSPPERGVLRDPREYRSDALEPCDEELLRSFPPAFDGHSADQLRLDPRRPGLWLALVRSGRAFVSRHGDADRPIVRGQAKKGRLGYRVKEDGTQIPALHVLDERTGKTREVTVFDLSPYGYLDWQTGEMGVLDFDIPAFRVESWRRGPHLAPRDVTESVRRAWSERGLPVPKPVVKRELPLEAEIRLTSFKSPLEGLGALVYLRAGVGGKLGPFDRIEPRPVEEDDRIALLAPPPAALKELRDALEAAGFEFPVHFGSDGYGLHYTFRSAELEYVVRKAVEGLPVRVVVPKNYAFRAELVDDVELGLADEGLGLSMQPSLVILVDGVPFDVLGPVLDSLRGGKWPTQVFSFVHEGRRFLLPVERLEPLRDLLLDLVERPGPPRISRLHALILPDTVIRRAPESFEALRHRVRFPPEVPLPRGLEATLRGYQLEGFRWLESRRALGLGAILADDMGLGKTVQTIALFLAAKADEQEKGSRRPCLVVAPKSVAPNWESELRRFAPSLRVVDHHGQRRPNDAAAWADADVIVTTYPILLRDLRLFAGTSFSVAVLDEAQTIKNTVSTTTRAAFKIDATFRLALTGTPMENHLGELWSIFRFALPELLPEEREFNLRYRKPIERDADPAASDELRARIAPFLLRRTKELVAKDLPAKTLTTTRIELEPAQREIYETVRAAMNARVREALATRGLARSHVVVLDALLKLRQVACDPRLLETPHVKKAGSAKLVHLLEMIRELMDEGRRVLIFSQFVRMLELVERELVRDAIPYTKLTGDTEDRADVIAKFQEGNTPVFLLSLKAGGAGLNLTAADVVIHYDPWWNPAVENQATDRAHRIGQEQPVFVYKLIGRDTVEERVLVLQARKQALFSAILDEGAGVAKGLDEEDLEFLFS